MKGRAILILAILVAGCATRMPPKMQSSALRDGAYIARANASRVDITPPPGVSTYGHGPDSLVADGFWSRLYCRVFALETNDESGKARVALVPCDLAAMSTLLQREVTARVEKSLGSTAVIMTATHTHAGPAHYFDARFYNDVFSTRLPGFDPLMLEFLATRISSGIVGAFNAQKMKPVSAAWAHTEVWGMTRNRSLLPFRMNPKSDFPPAPPLQCELPEQGRAVDPFVDVLRIDELDANGKPVGIMGALAFLAMHPTVISHTNRLLGADVFGVISRSVEREMRRSWVADLPECKKAAVEAGQDPPCVLRERDPVLGVINTNEGDVSPVWSAGDPDEATDIGSRMGYRIWQTLAAQAGAAAVPPAPAARTTINLRSAEVRLPGAEVPPAPGKQGGVALCDRPELGVSMAHGGSDHPTSLVFLSSFYEGNTAPHRADCQAPKRELLGVVQSLLASKGAFPDVAPLTLLQIGPVWISFVPAELTSTAGHRVNAAVLSMVAPNAREPQRAIVGGLANGYLQYVTTREEYELQHYEGASNVYGAATAEMLADRFARLALLIKKPDADSERQVQIAGTTFGAAQQYEYSVGPERKRLARPDGEATLAELGKDRHQHTLCRLVGTSPPSICFYWIDGAPAMVPLTAGPWISLVRDQKSARSCGPMLVRKPLRPACLTEIVAEQGKLLEEVSPSSDVCDPMAAVDDTGLDFQTRARGRRGDGYIWSTLFQPTVGEQEELQGACKDGHPCHRIRVKGPPDVESEPFAIGDGLRACSTEEARLCSVY